jgi:hypothetical protein
MRELNLITGLDAYFHLKAIKEDMLCLSCSHNTTASLSLLQHHLNRLIILLPFLTIDFLARHQSLKAIICDAVPTMCFSHPYSVCGRDPRTSETTHGELPDRHLR